MRFFRISLIRQLQTLGSRLLPSLSCTQSSAVKQSEGLRLISETEEIIFASGHLRLHGFIHKPKGDGPFPAILLNHGSEHPKSGKLQPFRELIGTPHSVSHEGEEIKPVLNNRRKGCNSKSLCQ